MKKRILSLFLCGAMSLSLLVGCGNAGSGSAAADGKIKIGVSIWSSTDVLGSQCKTIIDEAAEALGDVEVQYVDQGHVSEKVTASVEQLCAAGCQGVSGLTPQFPAGPGQPLGSARSHGLSPPPGALLQLS